VHSRSGNALGAPVTVSVVDHLWADRR
jgi:hypothetical protein